MKPHDELICLADRRRQECEREPHASETVDDAAGEVLAVLVQALVVSQSPRELRTRLRHYLDETDEDLTS